MDKRNEFEKLEDVSTRLGWNYTDDAETITLQRYSDFDQDFFIELDSDRDLYEQLYSYWQDFDPCSEAMKWLDEDGHGKNGAPYYMGDVLRDFENISDNLEDLIIAFRNEGL